jgi:carbonic anhydrase/acetyltransferase-like protein (isoleucine patch superfamily)
MAIYELQGEAPQLPEAGSFWIAPNAVLIGRVRLMKGSSVWFGAVLRGDNDWITVGENSNIQDNAVLHTDAGIPLEIGTNVTVGHSVTLHGCTIGDNCIIGTGATLLNRCNVGANSVVGAHALLAEGKNYPEQSLILGVPGRVVRALSDEDVKALPLAAAHYVENAQRYALGLKEVGR